MAEDRSLYDRSRGLFRQKEARGLYDNPPSLFGEMVDRFRGVDPETGEADYWKRGGLAGLLGMPSWDEQSPTDIAMGFAGSTTPALKGVAGALAKPQGIRAYHGSPHDFDRFDLSKIGTGEGAQAYGHGLYFAENPSVARDYRNSLAKPTEGTPRFRYKGEPVLVGNDHYPLASALENAAPKEGETAAALLQRRIAELTDQADFAKKVYGEDTAGMYTRKADILRKVDPAELTIHQPGRMYEVQINADPERFLDWDKPLSGQPGVQDNVFDTLRRSEVSAMEANDLINRKTGQDAVRRIARPSYPIRDDVTVPWRASGASSYDEALSLVGGDKRLVNRMLTPDPSYTSQALRQADIPGIKYLDQGSRGAANVNDLRGTVSMWERAAKKSPDDPYAKQMLDQARGDLAQAENALSRNYVVFDDKLIDILRKYGIGALIGGGAAQSDGGLF